MQKKRKVKWELSLKVVPLGAGASEKNIVISIFVTHISYSGTWNENDNSRIHTHIHTQKLKTHIYIYQVGTGFF